MSESQHQTQSHDTMTSHDKAMSQDMTTGHHHGAEAPDQSVLWTQEFWDDRYGSADRIWSGNPNQRLVEQTADLTPGTALDVGCGEGGDAIWLAARGWQVMAIDVSPVALERGAAEAAKLGPEIAGRIRWRQADLMAWEPPTEQFDLVSAHFIHLPSRERDVAYRQMADIVRPGGTLLIVGHHPSDMELHIGRGNHPDMMFTAEQLAAALPADEWQLEFVGAPGREVTVPDGRRLTIHDAILRATRRGDGS